MKRKVALVFVLALVAVLCVETACSQQAGSTSASLQQKISSLKELRDSGVISEQEYELKVNALRGSSAGGWEPLKADKALWTNTRQVEVLDPSYQMTAYTLSVPNDWKYGGMLARIGGCHGADPGLKATMESADGQYAIIQLPGVGWHWNSAPQTAPLVEQRCPSVEVDSAAGFLVNIVAPNMRPNAKIVEVLYPTSESQQALEQLRETEYQHMMAIARTLGFPPQRLTVDAARVRIQYERGGQPVEEMISAIVQCSDIRIPHDLLTCNSKGETIVRAPLGQLDALMAQSQFQELVNSAQPNPDWQSRFRQDQDMTIVRKVLGSRAQSQQMIAASNRNFQQMMNNNTVRMQSMVANNQAFIANQQAGTNRSIANARASQNALDASAHQTVLYALDQREFTNPNNGQTITASNRYAHTFLSQDGTTMYQGNGNLDPNSIPGSQTFTEIEPK